MKNLFTLMFSLIAFGLIGQTTYYQESFDGGLPADWTVEGEWAFGTGPGLSSEYFNVPDIGTGDMAIFNDDGLGGAHMANGSLTTGPIDLTALEAPLVLEMNSFFLNLDFQNNDERAFIEISTTGGESFSFLHEFTGAATFEPFNFDLSEFAGETVVFRMTYEDGGVWNYGWAFDNLTISDEVTLIERRDYLITTGFSKVMSEAQEGVDYKHGGMIVNNGLDVITSFDIVMSEGANSWTQSFTGVNVERGGYTTYEMDETLIVEGNKTYTVEINNVNGEEMPNANPANSTDEFSLNSYTSLNADRGVLVEEATGTWCPWCPRGTVFMDEMAKRFPDNFVGVAVHNNDPMVDVAYDGALTTVDGFTGFPSVVIERGVVADPGDIPARTLGLMNQAPPAALSVGAEVSGNSITTSIQVDFLTDVADAHSVAIVLTEDGVTGSDADRYFQANNYAGGGFGAMGGFEYLPSTVPAEFNIFNHVGRGLVGGWNGNADALDAEAYTAGMTDGWLFDEFTLPAGTNMDNLHVIGLLINNATGAVVNSTSAKILDAASNGLYDNVSANDVFDATLADVYPNPVSGVANINLSLANTADVTVTVINSLGQTVATRSYGSQSGDVQLQQNMTNLAEGMYMFNITAGDKFITKKINKVN